MDARDLLHWDGEHAERIVFAQIVLARERKPCEVGERPKVARMDPGRVVFLAVVRNPLVRDRNAGFEPLELQSSELVDVC